MKTLTSKIPGIEGCRSECICL